ncbi:MAG TPA: MFS transporter [Candidatus Dormibacteraeota bacterium]|nr:MFS transporter [Candidatus Dormibacteraeota bacterium]
MNYKRWTIVAAVLGSGIVFLDSTVVNVALPRIGQEMHSSLFGTLEAQAYVYSGYLLTLSALLILAGAISDFYGRKRMFIVGLAGFGVTSVMCGLAPTIEVLILARILQGVFGSLLVPGSLALLTATFEGEEQGRAFGIWAGASAGTTILGPFLGGILVDTLSWRAAFLINVPLVLVALWATYTHVRESRDETSDGNFDWLGAVVIAFAVGGLAFGAIYGQQHEWQGPIPFIALGLGALGLVVLPFEMRYAKHPLIPPSLFRSRNFTVTNIATLLIYGALYVTFYNVGLYMQGTLGYTAAAAGLSGIPGTLLLVLFSARFGALAGRIGPRWFMTIGPILMAVGVLYLARVPVDSQAWLLDPGHPQTLIPPLSYLVDFLPGLLIFGAGLTIMVAPLTTAVMTSVPSHNSGLASAINNAISRIGPQLAGAVIFVAITSGFYASLTQHSPSLDPNNPTVRQTISPLNRAPQGLDPAQAQAVRQASTDAMHLAMFFGAGLLLLGAAVSGFGIRNPQAPVVADAGGTPEEAHAPPEEEPPAREPGQRPAEVPTG